MLKTMTRTQIGRVSNAGDDVVGGNEQLVDGILDWLLFLTGGSRGKFETELLDLNLDLLDGLTCGFT